MSDNYQDLEYIDLQTLFVAKNKAFTQALRAKQPSHILHDLFAELDILYRLIKEKRMDREMAAVA